MIEVDGRKYNVPVNSVKLSTEFLYKYAERTEDFDLNYELGAIYHNQEIEFGMGKSDSDFSALWKILSTKSSIDDGTGHKVAIWTPVGKMEFLMYPNKLELNLVREKGDKTWWSGFKVKFIAVKPVESW